MSEVENKNEIEPGGVEGLDTPMVILVGLISAAFVFVVIVAGIAFFNAERFAEEERKIVNVRYDEFAGLAAEQQALLESYKVIDPESGIVAIPIGIAMRQIVQENQPRFGGFGAPPEAIRGAGREAPGGR